MPLVRLKYFRYKISNAIYITTGWFVGCFGFNGAEFLEGHTALITTGLFLCNIELIFYYN